MALGLPEEFIPKEASTTISCIMKGIFQWLTCTVDNNVDVLLDCFWESTWSSRCKCTRAPVKAPLNELCHHFMCGQNWQSSKTQRTVNHTSKCLHHRKIVCVVDAKGSFWMTEAAACLALHKVGKGLKDKSHLQRTQ